MTHILLPGLIFELLGSPIQRVTIEISVTPDRYIVQIFLRRLMLSFIVNEEILLIMVIMAVNEPMCQIFGQSELKQDWLLVDEEFDQADLLGVCLLKEEKLVS